MFMCQFANELSDQNSLQLPERNALNIRPFNTI